MGFCSQCGTRNDKTAKYCLNCGHLHHGDPLDTKTKLAHQTEGSTVVKDQLKSPSYPTRIEDWKNIQGRTLALNLVLGVYVLIIFIAIILGS